MSFFPPSMFFGFHSYMLERTSQWISWELTILAELKEGMPVVIRVSEKHLLNLVRAHAILEGLVIFFFKAIYRLFFIMQLRIFWVTMSITTIPWTALIFVGWSVPYKLWLYYCRMFAHSYFVAFLKDYVGFLNGVDFKMWKVTMNHQNFQSSLVVH